MPVLLLPSSLTEAQPLLLGDHGFASWSSTDPLDGNAEELLDVFDVFAAVLGKILVLLDVLNGLFPSRQLDVLNFAFRESVEIGREEGFERFTIEEIFGTNLDRFEVVENIEFGQVERGVAVDQCRVLHDDEIQPSASTSSTSCDTELGSYFLKVFSSCVELLGRERTSSDSSSISLDYSDSFTDRTRRKTETGANSSNAGSRRSDEGIGTEIEIEHEGVGTFN